jgi:branched-chain amino acid transport system ATP-binding protein
MRDLLAVDSIDAFYGRSHVLHGVSLVVGVGETVLLLGRNGAGKTTTMSAIMGLVSVGSGRIFFRGEDIRNEPPHRIAHRGIGLVPESRRMFASLTVRENLELGRKKPARDGVAELWDLDRIFALFPMLAPLQNRASGTLSGGQQQMLAIARTLMGNPTLLLLDEPAEGLAPILAETLAQRLADLRMEGVSMLISEQNLTFARLLADRAYVMESGTVQYNASLTDLDANPEAWTRFVAF